MTVQGETTQPQKEEPTKTTDYIPFKQFLEEYPIGTLQKVSGFCGWRDGLSAPILTKGTPSLRLYCAECNGTRNFEGEWTRSGVGNRLTDDFLVYTCRDCGKYEKHFCLSSRALKDNKSGLVIKIGEYPELYIKLPTNLPGLLGDDYKSFIKGLKSEKQGLGIGAYSYYRRVVENQKNRLLDEILKVCKKLSADVEMIKKIEQAKSENQFSTAIDMVKDALPESLLVDGHNPFKLLHKALSIGIHGEMDEKCLVIAHDIRMVLIDLAERIKLALSEQKDLKSAVSSLLKFNAEKGKSKKEETS